MRSRILLVALLLVWGVAAPAVAQVVREADASAVAGVLGGGFPDTSEWPFRSSGHEILFASLEADLYAVRASGDHATDTAGESGCGEETEGRFCLQVIDAGGTVVCQAARPAPPPGWQRDPRLACYLAAGRGQAEYLLRVSLTGPDGSCPALAVSANHARPQAFLLNVSLRRVASPGMQLHEAIARSRNRF